MKSTWGGRLFFTALFLSKFVNVVFKNLSKDIITIEILDEYYETSVPK